MSDSWFDVTKREPCSYRFTVEDITENRKPNVVDENDTILNDFAHQLLLAHASPEMIRQECNILLQELESLDLTVVKDYVESQVLPVKASDVRGSARIGNFGETLAAYLMAPKGFSFPIYKLRYREKQSWAMKLTDLCLINRDESLAKPIICYGEVKTKSSLRYSSSIGIEGHNSLLKDDALDSQEILKFFAMILSTSQRFEESLFLSKIRLGKIEYDKQYYIFLVHEKNSWKEEILNNLHLHPLDSRLEHFCVSVILIDDLKAVIDETYSRVWKGVEVILNE